MRKIAGLYLRFGALVLLMALLAACGKKSTTIASTTTPSFPFCYSVAFRNHSTFSWGVNTYGQLGNNVTTGGSVLVPQLVVGLPAIGMAGVSAGGTHALAFKNNSSVYAWGNNGYGQLGINSTTASPLPLQVAKYRLDGTANTDPLSRIIGVSAGFNHSLAIDSNNNVWAWGDNTYGQLGDGTFNVHYAAVPVLAIGNGSPLTGVLRIFAGGSHSLALMSNGTVMSWGYNAFGQLGNSVSPFNNISTGVNSPVPTAVVKYDPSIPPNPPNLTNVTDFAAAGSHSLFIVNDGVNPATLWVCGYNFRGQLGLGDRKNRNHGVVQVNLSAFPGVPVQVAAGLDHSLVLMSDHTVLAFGHNFSGQVGNNAALSTAIPVMSPVPVQKFDGNPLSGVTKIMAVGNTSFAIVNDGVNPPALWTWGDNTFGQLGLGDTTSRSYASQVPSLSFGADLYHP